MNKKKLTILLTILVCALAVGAGGIYAYRTHEAKVQAEEAEQKAKDKTYKALRKEYDTAETQASDSLYANTDGTILDDSAMDSAKEQKQKELSAYQSKIKSESMTDKDTRAFHALTKEIADRYQASKSSVDSLFNEVNAVDTNAYGTYYTDENKNEVTSDLSVYTDSYKNGKYRDAYSALTKVKSVYASVDSAKQQAEAQAAAEAAAKAEAEKKAQEERQAAQKAAEQKAAAKKNNASASSKSKSSAEINSSQSASQSSNIIHNWGHMSDEELQNIDWNNMSDEDRQALYKWEREAGAAADAEAQRLANETGRLVYSSGLGDDAHYYYADDGTMIK